MIRRTIPATFFGSGTKPNTVPGLSKTVSQANGAREEHVCPRECERPQVSYSGSGHAQFCPVRKYEAQQQYYSAEGVESQV